MHELALNHFERLGFLTPENFTGSGTVETVQGDIDVTFQANFPGRGNLFLPESARERDELLEYVFPGFE
jgi:hypothetical protein